MLIDDPSLETCADPILQITAGGRAQIHLCLGVYEIFHFGHSNWPPGYEQYPSGLEPYGVADNVEQIIAANPVLQDPDRKFVITVTRIKKSEQPLDGGWRWHKWGRYIGTQEPTYEYLFDEPSIDEVLCFHIYERMKS